MTITDMVAVVFIALCAAAIDSRRDDRAALAAQDRAAQRVAGNAPVVSTTESPEGTEHPS